MDENLRVKYNPDGSILRQHQLRMLDILIVIDEICKKYDIKYWISDGTLLGAIRHGGFIPWDDDLDIQMMRKDFKRFIKIVQAELPQNLILQTHKTDKGYVAPYAKIRDLNSLIVECHNCDINYKYRGIYIDIFPMEKCSYFFTRIADAMHIRFIYNISHVSAGIFRRLYLHYMYNFLMCFYSVFREIDSLFVKSGNITFTYGSASGYYDFAKTDVLPLSERNFEGHTFYAPYAPEVILMKQYGDYMKLPVEENRIAHTQTVEFKKI